MDTLSKEASRSKLSWSPSEEESTFKGTDSFPKGSVFIPLRVNPLFRRGFRVLERIQEVTIIVFLLKTTETLPAVLGRLKTKLLFITAAEMYLHSKWFLHQGILILQKNYIFYIFCKYILGSWPMSFESMQSMT